MLPLKGRQCKRVHSLAVSAGTRSINAISGAVTVSGKFESGAPTISGGPLDGSYKFSQLHFHWGPNDSEGSEHTFEGRRYTRPVGPGEMITFRAWIASNGNVNSFQAFSMRAVPRCRW